MSMSTCLKNYLDHHHVEYQLIAHRRTDTAFNAARAAHIAAGCMVKGVLLHDEQGYVMAAVPANQSVDIDDVNQKMGRQLDLAQEKNLSCILNDCSQGAVPALGEAYGIPTVWDQALMFQPSFYIEAGDHEELVRLNHFDFMNLMDGSDNLIIH